MDRIVVVTGGTKGIGFATAKKFAQNGDTVVVLGRNEAPEAIKNLQSFGAVEFIKADVSREEDCRTAVKEVLSRFGRIDVLANVAGVVGKRDSFLEVDLADVKNTIEINLMGTIYMCQYVAKAMAERHAGVIVNIGSICGFMANTEAIGYHASKGGVKMVTQALGRELSPYGIRVVSVAPGWVRTGLVTKEMEEIGCKLHMKGRIIEPEEIAGAVYLLSLPEASAINGTTVMVDDGYSSFKGVDGFQAY